MFAVRGTRLTKTGTVQADIQLLRDRDAELYYSQRALKHVQKHIRRLSAEQPDVQWGFFITGDFTASRPDSLMSTVGLCCTTEIISRGLAVGLLYHRRFTADFCKLISPAVGTALKYCSVDLLNYATGSACPVGAWECSRIDWYRSVRVSHTRSVWRHVRSIWRLFCCECKQ